MPEIKYAVTPALKIAYLEFGSAQGWPVVLTHGFPYDVHAFDEVAAILVNNGARVILPYIRGFGPTSFISAEIIRSGQQAARGSDLIGLIEVLGLTKPIIGGYDWGGNASSLPPHYGRIISVALFPTQVMTLLISSNSSIPFPRPWNEYAGISTSSKMLLNMPGHQISCCSAARMMAFFLSPLKMMAADSIRLCWKIRRVWV